MHHQLISQWSVKECAFTLANFISSELNCYYKNTASTSTIVTKNDNNVQFMFIHIMPTCILLFTDSGVRKCARPSFISWVPVPVLYSGVCRFLPGVFASNWTPPWTNLWTWLNGVRCFSPIWAEWIFLTGLHNCTLFIGVELLHLSATTGLSGVLLAIY